jgi:hypothetical protein
MLFLGMSVTTSIAGLMRMIETGNSKWINEKKFIMENCRLVNNL